MNLCLSATYIMNYCHINTIGTVYHYNFVVVVYGIYCTAWTGHCMRMCTCVLYLCMPVPVPVVSLHFTLHTSLVM